jgi:hypothetical protein
MRLFIRKLNPLSSAADTFATVAGGTCFFMLFKILLPCAFQHSSLIGRNILISLSQSSPCLCSLLSNARFQISCLYFSVCCRLAPFDLNMCILSSLVSIPSFRQLATFSLFVTKDFLCLVWFVGVCLSEAVRVVDDLSLVMTRIHMQALGIKAKRKPQS